MPKSFLDFCLKEMTFKYNIKSEAIKHLKLLAQGLCKNYNQNKKNFYSKLLIKLFDFEVDIDPAADE